MKSSSLYLKRQHKKSSFIEIKKYSKEVMINLLLEIY